MGTCLPTESVRQQANADSVSQKKCTTMWRLVLQKRCTSKEEDSTALKIPEGMDFYTNCDKMNHDQTTQALKCGTLLDRINWSEEQPGLISL